MAKRHRKKQEPKKRGRPSSFAQKIADEICSRLSAGEVLNQILMDAHMPTRPTVTRWLRARPEFQLVYTQARTELLDHWAEEILVIGDDGSNDWVERETRAGRIVKAEDHEVVNRSRLRCDNRKWLLSKLRPELYGDRVDLSNKDGSLAASFAAGMAASATKYPLGGKTNGAHAANQPEET